MLHNGLIIVLLNISIHDIFCTILYAVKCY